MQLNCDVTECVQISNHTYKVMLKADKEISFKAGQYLFFLLNEEDKRPFSIANVPHSRIIELHIGASGYSDFANEVIKHIKSKKMQNQKVNIDVGHGNAWLREKSNRPKLLIAGGTGFSYVKSIMEKVILDNQDETIFVYWGTKTKKDLYCHQQVLAYQQKYKNFNYEATIESNESHWNGRYGNVLDILDKDFIDYSSYDIYICGPVPMVGKARDMLITKGALIEHMYADAFDYI